MLRGREIRCRRQLSWRRRTSSRDACTVVARRYISTTPLHGCFTGEWLRPRLYATTASPLTSRALAFSFSVGKSGTVADSSARQSSSRRFSESAPSTAWPFATAASPDPPAERRPSLPMAVWPFAVTVPDVSLSLLPVSFTWQKKRVTTLVGFECSWLRYTVHGEALRVGRWICSNSHDGHQLRSSASKGATTLKRIPVGGGAGSTVYNQLRM